MNATYIVHQEFYAHSRGISAISFGVWQRQHDSNYWKGFIDTGGHRMVKKMSSSQQIL